MGRLSRAFATAGLLLLGLQAAARADDDLKSENSQILAQVAEADGVFTIADDGSLHHVQSGLVCPASFPSMKLYHVLVFPGDAGKGSDVGCDYRRPDDKGGANAKLTIFATRAADGVTLDDAFAKYRNEVVTTYQGITSVGPALVVEDKSKTPAMPETRSEEFTLPLNGRTYSSDLIVCIKNGWIIEIRGTYSGMPNEIVATDDKRALDDALADRAAPATAFVMAVASLGSKQ
jgi:hypothetical protein